jgi:hypothetical protein
VLEVEERLASRSGTPCARAGSAAPPVAGSAVVRPVRVEGRFDHDQVRLVSQAERASAALACLRTWAMRCSTVIMLVTANAATAMFST